jgi:hypothetical protein
MSVYNYKKKIFVVDSNKLFPYGNKNSVLIWRECMPPGNSSNLSQEGKNGHIARAGAGRSGRQQENTARVQNTRGL